MDNLPPPPKALTKKQAEYLIEWLEWMANAWPRVMSTLALQRLNVSLEEIQLGGAEDDMGVLSRGGLQEVEGLKTWEVPRLDSYFTAGLGSRLPQVNSFCWLTAMLPRNSIIESRVEAGGKVRFILHYNK